jgi:hypothetical protein
MRRRCQLVLGITAVALTISIVFAAAIESRGVGRREILVCLKSTNPIKQVAYCDVNIDEALRRKAEETADPQLFDLTEAKVSGNEFTARILITSKSNSFSYRVYHRSHLVVYAEFTDGTQACRIAALPTELSREVIYVDFN